MPDIRIQQADITKLKVDAIVNAANECMLGGGGVDGAIHRAAGPQLLEACRAVPEVRPGVRCPTGQARITPGFELSAAHVIHTVGPVWRGGEHDEHALLASAYRASFELAEAHGVRTIAFPAISCGVYRFPIPRACAIAVHTIREHLARTQAIELVLLIAFDKAMLDALHAAASAP